MADFLLPAQAVLPVFLIIVLGFILKRTRFIDDSYVQTSSQIVFKIALPALIFTKIAETDFTKIWDSRFIVFIVGGTMALIGLIWLGARLFIQCPDKRGVFVQGSFRSNIAIIGLSVIAAGFSDEAMYIGTVILALLMPVYNITAVIILYCAKKEHKRSLVSILSGVMTNPLFLTAVLGIIFSLLNIPLPGILKRSAAIVGSAALPIALINVGASMYGKAGRSGNTLVWIAVFLKTAVVPAVMTAGAVALGYGGERLAALFIVTGCPAAVSSYIMAKGMGCNSTMAGSIVTWSTLVSMATISAGLVILRGMGLF